MLKLQLDSSLENTILDTEIEVFTKGKHEETRCHIQNEVFNEDNRIPITIDDIFLDEIQDYYFDEGAIFIKKDDKYIGYGQLIIDKNTASIVNVGILEAYRGNGYGKRLLKYLLQLAKHRGFNEVHLKVASNNYVALKLYQNLGFTIEKECYTLEYEKAGK